MINVMNTTCSLSDCTNKAHLYRPICLRRRPVKRTLFRYGYQYLALLDTDEVIVPTEAATWTEMMDQIGLNSTGWSTVAFRNVYFLDEMDSSGVDMAGVPARMHMARHVTRYT